LSAAHFHRPTDEGELSFARSTAALLIESSVGDPIRSLTLGTGEDDASFIGSKGLTHGDRLKLKVGYCIYAYTHIV
jgi:hypothetical protein